MSSVIAAYLDDLRRLGAEPVRFLNPGAADAGQRFRQRYPELDPPDDLFAMWRTFDGLSYEQPTTCDQVWLEGAFYILSEAEALDDYAASIPLWESDETFADYWPRGFFPFAKPGDGSRLLVNCLRRSPTYGAVYELFHGVGISKSSRSITDYFATASAWLAEGVTWLDERKYVSRDLEKSRLIAARLNPGCDSWDDNLPPAYEMKDWL